MTKKRMKDALILFLITVIVGVCLGAVHGVTAAPIAKAEYTKTQNAYKAVFSNAAKFEDLPGFSASAANKLVTGKYPTNTIDGCVQAVDSNGKLLGYVVEASSSKGYGGTVTVQVGIRLDGTVNGYSPTVLNETAGLGMKASEPAFKDQFNNKKVDEFVVTKSGAKSDNEINAISGATITSRAVTTSVDAAMVYAKDLAKQYGGKLQK